MLELKEIIEMTLSKEAIGRISTKIYVFVLKVMSIHQRTLIFLQAQDGELVEYARTTL
jgi:hypothetical protein